MSGLCKFNKQINCAKHVGCEKCNWNPEYFAEKIRKARAERAARIAKAELEAFKAAKKNKK